MCPPPLPWTKSPRIFTPGGRRLIFIVIRSSKVTFASCAIPWGKKILVRSHPIPFPHLEGSLLHVVILRAVEEGRHESVDGVPHDGEVVALSPDALQRVPDRNNAATNESKPATDRVTIRGQCEQRCRLPLFRPLDIQQSSKRLDRQL